MNAAGAGARGSSVGTGSDLRRHRWDRARDGARVTGTGLCPASCSPQRRTSRDGRGRTRRVHGQRRGRGRSGLLRRRHRGCGRNAGRPRLRGRHDQPAPARSPHAGGHRDRFFDQRARRLLRRGRRPHRRSRPAPAKRGRGWCCSRRWRSRRAFPPMPRWRWPKGAVEGLALSLAAELAPQVRVNVVAPSLTRTPLAAAITGNATLAQGIAAMHALPAPGDGRRTSRGLPPSWSRRRPPGSPGR